MTESETKTFGQRSQPQMNDGRPSVGELVHEVADDVLKLMRQEMQLAKLEVKDDVTQAAKAGGMLGGAGIAAHLFLIFLSVTVMFALNEVMDIVWAALIVSAIWGIAAYVLYLTGRRRMSTVNFTPEQTIQTLKEDVQWAQNRTN
jgi:uncharacterized membrane protein YqjE